MTFDDATISKAICNLLGYDDDNHPETFDYEKVWFRAVAQITGRKFTVNTMKHKRVEPATFAITAFELKYKLCRLCRA